jgi:ribose transport system ATP-binding protein
MVGREIEGMDLGDPRSAGETVLEVRNLSLPWPGHARKWRLRDISFHLRRGEIVGIAGLMGAGRTELLECLFGASPEPPRGELLLEGRAIPFFHHPAEAKRAGIALVTEDRKRLGVFSQMNVGENITICTLRQVTRGGLIRQRQDAALAQSMVDRLASRPPDSRPRSWRSAAAISRNASLAAGCSPSPKSCSWTIRLGASTSARKPNCTG